MNREMDWTGTTGIVTGAGSGIGAAIAALLVELGADVVGVDLIADGLDRTAASSAGGVGRFQGVLGDVTVSDVQQQALAAAAPKGRLDFLVNNAAVFLLAGLHATHEQWTRTLAVNLVAVAEFTARSVPLLAKSPRASVVNIASISAHIAQADRWTYNSAKAGVVELTRCQALDLTPLRVNSVSPGWIWTEVLDEASGGDRAAWEPVWGGYCPEGRCGEPREVAMAVEFLLSPRASFITGVDLPVDGGYLATSSEGAAVLALGK